MLSGVSEYLGQLILHTTAIWISGLNSKATRSTLKDLSLTYTPLKDPWCKMSCILKTHHIEHWHSPFCSIPPCPSAVSSSSINSCKRLIRELLFLEEMCWASRLISSIHIFHQSVLDDYGNWTPTSLSPSSVGPQGMWSSGVLLSQTWSIDRLDASSLNGVCGLWRGSLVWIHDSIYQAGGLLLISLFSWGFLW